MANSTAKIILSLTLIVAAAFTPGQVSLAAPIASIKSDIAVISHIPPKPSSLPAPGNQMELTITLKNTKDSERKLQAMIVKDGQLQNLVIPSGKFNVSDEPSYTFSFAAPLGELIYQFILYNPDGTFTISEKYSIRRSCIPDVTLAPDQIPDEIQGDKKILELIAQSQSLDRDIENFERVMKLLQELKTLTRGANR